MVKFGNIPSDCMTTPASLLNPFSRLVTITLLGKEVDVPENNF